MTDRECQWCGAGLNLARSDARTCSTRCRVAAHRAAKRAAEARMEAIPAELREIPRWVRWKSRRRGSGTTKAPLTTAGRSASSTDQATWTTYAEVAASTVGDGAGFVLNGDGLACIDLDGVLDGDRLDPRASALLAEVDPFLVERSPSGRGLHAWVRHGSPTGRSVYTRPDGLRVEWYTDGRYMTVTGDRFTP